MEGFDSGRRILLLGDRIGTFTLVEELSYPLLDSLGWQTYAAFPIADRNHVNLQGLGDIGLQKMEFEVVFLDLVAKRAERLVKLLARFPVRRIRGAADPDVNRA
jgi:hypothetical protein